MNRIVFREDSFFFTIFHCEDEEQGPFTVIKPHYGELAIAMVFLIFTFGILAWVIYK